MRKLDFLLALSMLITPCTALAATEGGSAQDAAFVQQASASGLAEIAAGQLAETHGNNHAIKDFGKRMIKDHTQANQMLTAIAQRRHFQLATTPLAEDQQKALLLTQLKGTAFDTRYLEKMIEDHQKVVALFQTEASSGSDPELKAFAAKTLPVLQHHLRMAEALSGPTKA